MEYRIHIGAHKTATTQFQDILERVFVDHPDGDRKYLTRAHLRENKFVDLDVKRHSFFKSQLARPGNGLWRSSIINRLSEPHDSKTRILISEEDILGTSHELLDGFYLNATKYLTTLKKSLGSDNVKIYLSVRDYSEILVSAYCQCLRKKARMKTFEHYKNLFSSNNRGWHSLINDIRNVFPRENIIVWTFDSYVRNPISIVEFFSGSKINFSGELPNPANVKRLTVEQVSRLEALIKDGKTNAKEVKKILSINLSDPAYSPIRGDELTSFSRRYQEDVQNIKEMGIQVA